MKSQWKMSTIFAAASCEATWQNEDIIGWQGNPSDCGNHRGASLLPICSLIMAMPSWRWCCRNASTVCPQTTNRTVHSHKPVISLEGRRSKIISLKGRGSKMISLKGRGSKIITLENRRSKIISMEGRRSKMISLDGRRSNREGLVQYGAHCRGTTTGNIDSCSVLRIAEWKRHEDSLNHAEALWRHRLMVHFEELLYNTTWDENFEIEYT